MTRLVLLPGLDGTGDLFAPFIEVLQGIPTQVVRYPPDRPMNYAAHEAFARAELPRDEDYVLLAESFSGPVGITLAAERPPRLKGLALCVSFVSNPLPVFGGLARLVERLPAARMPAVLAAPWLYAGRGTPALRRLHAAAMARVSAQVLRARVAALLSVDRCAELRRVTVPMLYLRATRDRLVPSSAGRRVLEVRPDVQRVEIEGPHMLLQTEPAACAAALRDFLRRCSA
jgi:pimeloyl-ACP methyl ester carboxylesterase